MIIRASASNCVACSDCRPKGLELAEVAHRHLACQREDCERVTP